jgi:hypothetical protein
LQAVVLAAFEVEAPWPERWPFIERAIATVGRQREWAPRTGYPFEIDRAEKPKIVEGDRRVTEVPIDLPTEKWVPQIEGEISRMVAEFNAGLKAQWPGIMSHLFVKAVCRLEMFMAVHCKEIGTDEFVKMAVMKEQIESSIHRSGQA